MRLSDKIVNYFIGKDVAKEHARLDAAIAENKAEIRQGEQAFNSGVRLLTLASGMLEMIAAGKNAQENSK